MANLKVTRQVQAPNIDYEDFSLIAVPNVPASTQIKQGSCWSLDITQPGISPASLIAPVGIISNVFFPAWTQTAEVVVPPFSANAGKAYGVYQGPTFTLTSPPLTTAIPLRVYGAGLVLASAEGANAVNTGSNLIISATQYGAKQGTAALNSNIGTAMAYAINTSFSAALNSTGSQTIQVPSIAGISTATSLVFDSPSSGVQETATPSAVVSGVNANQTYTVANAGTVSTLTATIGGIAATYVTTAADTATTAAVALIKAINAVPGLVAGPSPIILPPTNSAGVITVRAINAGTASNTVTTTATVTGGSVTLTAGGATLASGTNNTLTATFVNTHAAGAPIQGLANTNAAVLIPGTANALQNYLVNAMIQIL